MKPPPGASCTHPRSCTHPALLAADSALIKLARVAAMSTEASASRAQCRLLHLWLRMLEHPQEELFFGTPLWSTAPNIYANAGDRHVSRGVCKSRTTQASSCTLAADALFCRSMAVSSARISPSNSATRRFALATSLALCAAACSALAAFASVACQARDTIS